MFLDLFSQAERKEGKKNKKWNSTAKNDLVMGRSIMKSAKSLKFGPLLYTLSANIQFWSELSPALGCH